MYLDLFTLNNLISLSQEVTGKARDRPQFSNHYLALLDMSYKAFEFFGCLLVHT